jgi:hypothetical protein
MEGRDMSSSWFAIEIQNGTGSPAAKGTNADFTIVNQSGTGAYLANGDIYSTPLSQLVQVMINNNDQNDVVRKPGVDLIVEVVRIVETDPPATPIPGDIAIPSIQRTVLGTYNLTRLASTEPGGGKPTFFLDVNGAINTISPF